MSGVSCHLVKVLFLSSLGLGLLCIEVGTDLGKGFLCNPRLLLPCGECLLPSRELLLPREEQILQLLNHCHRWRRHGGTRRKGRRKRPAQSEHRQINNASRNRLSYRKLWPEPYLLTSCTQWVPTVIVIR
jgi:hypothetical protein